MLYLLTTVDKGVASNPTQEPMPNAIQGKMLLTKGKSEKHKTKANRKIGALLSKYGCNGSSWYVLHEDVHHAPI